MHLPNDELCPIDRLAPYANNARTHSRKQIRQIAESIKRFGFTNPVLIADDNTIIAGHGRVEAARSIGMSEVPIRKLSHLSHDEVRAYILADNKLAENAGWDRDLLAIEMQGLIELDPLYCDTITRRFERVTGERAVLAETGATFADVGAKRLAGSRASGQPPHSSVTPDGGLRAGEAGMDGAGMVPASPSSHQRQGGES